MGDGRKIENWIEAGKIAKKYGREEFFGIFIQAGVDDGTFFVVVFNKADNAPMVGGISATRQDIEALKELGVTIDDRGGWLK